VLPLVSGLVSLQGETMKGDGSGANTLRIVGTWKLPALFVSTQIQTLLKLNHFENSDIDCACGAATWLLERGASMTIENINPQTIANHGCLGNRNDEGRSEMRYVMWIAEFRESSNPWTHMALLSE
jgi:hypothetical protein